MVSVGLLGIELQDMGCLTSNMATFMIAQSISQNVLFVKLLCYRDNIRVNEMPEVKNYKKLISFVWSKL